jgi:hypothetical protein
MVIRVESNLPLISPSNDAAKTSGPKVRSYTFDLDKSASSHGLSGTSSGNSDTIGKYYSLVGESFDEYYSSLVVLLSKLLMDEAFVEVHGGVNSFSRNYQVRSFHVLSLVKSLIECKYSPLVVVACRVCTIAIRLNPLNSVVMETRDLIGSLVCCAVKLQFCGRLDIEEAPRVSSREGGFSHEEHTTGSTQRHRSANPLDSNFLELLDELLLVLQLFAVSYSRHSSSILAVFSVLLLSIWSPTSLDNVLQKNLRCLNCESEYACFECISERYGLSLLFAFPHFMLCKLFKRSLLQIVSRL